MEAEDITQHCFRCKGLSVIDPWVISRLPRLLYQAAAILADAQEATSYEEFREGQALVQSLREYALILESIPDD